MLFKNISILDQEFNLQHNMYVGIKEDKIDYIGTELPTEDYGSCYNGTNKLLMSGLYNNHTHSPMTLLRGYSDNLRYTDWLNSIQPFQNKMSDANLVTGTNLAIAEMLRCGTVSCTEMYVAPDIISKVFGNAGFKVNVSRGISTSDDHELSSLPYFKEIAFIMKYMNGNNNGRIRSDVGIQGDYYNNPDLLKQIASYAKENNANIHVHISESKKEHEACLHTHNMTPAALLASSGILDQPTTAAHCIWAEDSDIQIFKEHNVTVACCPYSNLKLGEGFTNIPAMLKQGVPITLGSDGAASNNSLNLFSDMKLFATIYNAIAGNPTAITAKDTLKAATINGALAQGRTDCGSLEVGKKADLIVIDLDQPHLQPTHDIVSNLVLASTGNDVVLTMIDGRVLYQNGEYLSLDIEKVLYNAKRSVDKIHTRLQFA